MLGLANAMQQPTKEPTNQNNQAPEIVFVEIKNPETAKKVVDEIKININNNHTPIVQLSPEETSSWWKKLSEKWRKYKIHQEVEWESWKEDCKQNFNKKSKQCVKFFLKNAINLFSRPGAICMICAVYGAVIVFALVLVGGGLGVGIDLNHFYCNQTLLPQNSTECESTRNSRFTTDIAIWLSSTLFLPVLFSLCCGLSGYICFSIGDHLERLNETAETQPQQEKQKPTLEEKILIFQKKLLNILGKEKITNVNFVFVE